MPEPVEPEIVAYTELAARLLGIELDADELEPVAGQVARVASLVEEMERIDDDAIVSAPRFRAGPPSGQR